MNNPTEQVKKQRYIVQAEIYLDFRCEASSKEEAMEKFWKHYEKKAIDTKYLSSSPGNFYCNTVKKWERSSFDHDPRLFS